MKDKQSWRAWARAQRAMLPGNQGDTTVLLAKLVQLPAFVGARHILLFLAMPGEVAGEAVQQPGDGKHWYAPRCAPKRRLAIHPYVPGETPLRAGPFGIREPDPEQVPEVEPSVLDMVLVPGLVFGEEGRRVGYGGGYYDRFLPRTRPDCLRVGVMPSGLVVPAGELPVDPWDVPLDIILTEEKIISCKRA